MAANRQRLTEGARDAIEWALLNGLFLSRESAGELRRHPMYVVTDVVGEVVACGHTREQACFRAWLAYVTANDSP